MASFVITNLKDVEDSGAARWPGIEARYARSALESEHLGVSYVRFDPGVRSPRAHSHHQQEEVYAVIRGSGRIQLDGEETRPIGPLDVILVRPSVFRAFEAGPDGLEMIAIGSDDAGPGDGVSADYGWVEESG
jgi:quercetin dioxygenase-like cupin family protein